MRAKSQDSWILRKEGNGEWTSVSEGRGDWGPELLGWGSDWRQRQEGIPFDRCGGLEDLGWSSSREDNGFHLTPILPEQSELENNGASPSMEDPGRRTSPVPDRERQGTSDSSQAPPPLGPRSLYP